MSRWLLTCLSGCHHLNWASPVMTSIMMNVRCDTVRFNVDMLITKSAHIIW